MEYKIDDKVYQVIIVKKRNKNTYIRVKEDMNIYRGIILATKQNSNIKYQLIEIEELNDHDDTIEEDTNVDHTTQPIPALITYIKDKYDMDASDKLSEYEAILNKEKKTD